MTDRQSDSLFLLIQPCNKTLNDTFLQFRGDNEYFSDLTDKNK